MPVKRLPYKSLHDLVRRNLSISEDHHTIELIKTLKKAKKRGWLQKVELIEICYWKSPRAIRHIESNHPKSVKKFSRLAFRTSNEEEKITYLTQLCGVSIPMASAILTLIDPKKYGVIDIRVWETLYAVRSVNANPNGTNFRFSQWDHCLKIIRSMAQKFGVKTRDIERTIFYVHKKYQVGTLYRKTKSKK